MKKKILFLITPMVLTNMAFGLAQEGTEVKTHQEEINAKYINKAKKELSKEDLLKLEKEINEVPVESTKDYDNTPKKFELNLKKLLGESYVVEKRGVLFHKESKKKVPIRGKFTYTGISNKIISNGKPIYRAIEKIEITMITDDKLEEIKNITYDENMNIEKTIITTKVNGKEISKTTCDRISENDKIPEKVSPKYVGKPYQLKCDDKSIVTTKFSLDFGDKELESKIKFNTRIRNNDGITTTIKVLNVNIDKQINDIVYIVETKDTITAIK